jgi:CBS domain-containing protein
MEEISMTTLRLNWTEPLAPTANRRVALERSAVSRRLSGNDTPVTAAKERLPRVSDAMSTDFISVAPDTSVREVAAKLAKHGVSSVPVIDGRGRLVGVVSEGDLIRRVEIGTEPSRSWWRSFLSDSMGSAHAYVRSHGRLARDVMSVLRITTSPDEPLHKLAARMVRKRLKRVPVVRDGRVVGVIARRDLVRKLARHPVSPADVNDDVLRKELVDRMRTLPWSLQAHVANTEVQDGVASLYGWAATPIERRAIEVVAENTPGVVQVRNHLNATLPYV